MEKMTKLMDAGRVVCSVAFIVSAWRQYQAFNLNGSCGVAVEEYVVGLDILMKLFGGILFIFNAYVGAFILLIHQAMLSPIYQVFLQQREFNTSFMGFIKNVGIVAALVCFIAMKHRHGVSLKKQSVMANNRKITKRSVVQVIPKKDVPYDINGDSTVQTY